MKNNIRILFLLPMLAIMLIPACNDGNDEPVTGMINGTVRDSAGTGVGSAEVRTEPQTVQVATNDTGYFEIPDVAAGAYKVFAEKSTYLSDSASAQVDSGQVSTVGLILIRSYRTVLAEMLTRTCECAYGARREAYAVKAGHPDRFVYLEYHASTDPMVDWSDPFTNPASEARRLYYCDTFVLGHFMYFDGTILQTATGDFEATVDSLLDVASPLQVQIAGTYSPATYSGHIDVTVTARAGVPYSDLYLEYAIYERGPMPPPDTVMCEYVALDRPAHDPLVIGQGETRIFGKDFTVPDTIGLPNPPFHVVDPADIGIAVFVQSLSAKEVLQAAFKDF
jgi:hypothetical protein